MSREAHKPAALTAVATLKTRVARTDSIPSTLPACAAIASDIRGTAVAVSNHSVIVDAQRRYCNVDRIHGGTPFLVVAAREPRSILVHSFVTCEFCTLYRALHAAGVRILINSRIQTGIQ